jgi:hypothetical protein
MWHRPSRDPCNPPLAERHNKQKPGAGRRALNHWQLAAAAEAQFDATGGVNFAT